MSLIKPRTRCTQFVGRVVKLDRETNETLFAHAHFLCERSDYVLNEVIDTVSAEDKEFHAWRTENTALFVPPVPASELPRKRRNKRRGDSALFMAETADESALIQVGSAAE